MGSGFPVVHRRKDSVLARGSVLSGSLPSGSHVFAAIGSVNRDDTLPVKIRADATRSFGLIAFSPRWRVAESVFRHRVTFFSEVKTQASCDACVNQPACIGFDVQANVMLGRRCLLSGSSSSDSGAIQVVASLKVHAGSLMPSDVELDSDGSSLSPK
ncbi:hypothetical protein OAF09_00255 [bacterium]|nr:hypothetical protein [bacterium]MDC0278686.1 hypothetical protein [bacterium]